jgi:hypothetical protein
MVTTFGSGFYFIEIKWLGSNGKTSYELDRLTAGLRQLGAYAVRSTLPELATLVAYDARSEEEFKKLPFSELISEGVAKIETCEGVSVPAIGSCYVLFLFSKTASES